MNTLNGKVAVVTGASKGIGAAIAQALALEGASVVVNYASSREGADKVVVEIKAKGGKAVAVHGDVSKAADITRLLAETKKAYGQLDILVNNAGIFQFDALEAVTEAEFHRQFNTNVLGTLLMTQAALKHFGPAGGSVINVSSVISENPMPNSSVYAATKGAVDVITRGLARELAARKIRVNAIAPGGVETEGTRTMGMIGGDMEKQLVSATPLGRIGQPKDIASVAVFLASEASSWITGERLIVAGGFR